MAGRAGTGRRTRRRARRHRRRPRDHAAGRHPRHRHRRGRGRRTAAADRDRQLRAPPGGVRRGDRAGPRPLRDAPDPGDLAGAPAGGRRGGDVGLAARARRRRDLRRGDPVRGAGRHGPARVRHLRRADRGGGGRDLRDARRASPGHRAGRGADGGDERDRGARPARRPVPAADRPGVRTGSSVTLRHAVAWSFDLLDDAEREVLRTASVFAGGFDLPALCAVAGTSDDVEALRLLDSLVRKSLVVAHHGCRTDPVQPVRDHPDVRRRAFAQVTDREAAAGPARRPLRERGGRAMGAVERSRMASRGGLGAGRAGQPAVGLPVERRSRPGRRWRPTSPPTLP